MNPPKVYFLPPFPPHAYVNSQLVQKKNSFFTWSPVKPHILLHIYWRKTIHLKKKTVLWPSGIFSSELACSNLSISSTTTKAIRIYYISVSSLTKNGSSLYKRICIRQLIQHTNSRINKIHSLTITFSSWQTLLSNNKMTDSKNTFTITIVIWAFLISSVASSLTGGHGRR